MVCDLQRVEALLLGELPAQERSETLQHIESCPQCGAYYRHLAALEGIEVPSEGFHGRVMDAVRTTAQRKSRRSPFLQWAAAAAAVAVVVLAGVGDRVMAPDHGMAGRSAVCGYPAYERLVIGGGALVQDVRRWMAQQQVERDIAGSEEVYLLTQEQRHALQRDFPALTVPEGTVYVVLPVE